MDVLTILPQAFLDELPDDSPAAFTLIARRGLEYLQEQLQYVDDNERSSWASYQSAQHTVVNLIIASARRLEIEPFSTMDVPRKRDFDNDAFEEFKSTLDHYLTQFLLDNVIRARRDSITMSGKAKDRIRSHIHGMKQQIDAADIPEARRSTLHAKLREFEIALDKDRVSYLVITRILLEILSVSANVLALADSPTMAKLTANIMQVVAEAKAADDSQRPLPPFDPPRMALPPRRAEETPRRESFSDDIDDEIPF